jgi:hypothetical protein
MGCEIVHKATIPRIFPCSRAAWRRAMRQHVVWAGSTRLLYKKRYKWRSDWLLDRHYQKDLDDAVRRVTEKNDASIPIVQYISSIKKKYPLPNGAPTSVATNNACHFKQRTICFNVACTEVDLPPSFSFSFLPGPTLFLLFRFHIPATSPNL